MEERQREYLHGLRVVDLTRLLPGPFATMLLGDMGAEVIKVEDPGLGDYARYYPPMVGESSAFFQSVNRNKKFVTLNLKESEGQDLLRRILKTADVLVESFRPAVMDRLGLGIEELRREFPSLIIASITGFGQEGVRRGDAGHDANFLAISGVLGVNGSSQGPQLPGIQLADLAGGALYGALGITAALYRKERTGEGTHLDISMTEGALSFLLPTLAREQAGEKESPGLGMLTGGLPRYGLYRTRDDRYLAVAALEPKFWDPFVTALDLEELKGRGMVGGEDGEEVRRALEAIIGAKTFSHWESFFRELDVCVDPIYNLEEVLELEIHKVREVFFQLQGVTQARTPLTPRGKVHRAAQEAGADNEEIFAELGLSEDEVKHLKGKGVL